MGSHHLKLRPNYPRSRTGCLTCRVRKKKCDELKPRCAGCRRNQIACEWPSVVSDPSSVFIHHGSPPSTIGTINDSGQSCSSVVTSDLLAHGISLPGIQPQPQALNTVDRAAGLTPLSLLLLRHYVQETGPALAMRTPSDSPFLTTVLPLAYMDDLLMHSLLALSGTHLAYKQGSDHGILHATALHYSKALSGLRHEFAHLHDGTSPQEPRLLLVLMMICHYESLSADVGGAVFSHLKASRQLALSLQSRLKSRPDRRTINNEIAGFALEIYAYLLFVNNVTPYGAILNRTLPFDDFVLSLDSLSSFSTFGTMFAGAHELFELIPQVSVLASQSIAEESAGQETPSSELLAKAEDLSARISSWTMTETRCTERPGDWEQKLLAAAALQQGLHIYLATAKAGSTVKDPAVAVQIQGHVDVILHIMEMLTDSEFDCTLIWPCVIGGSCMVIPEQQRSFTLRVLNNRHKMKHLKTICDTLQLLWDDDSPSSYGPHGLSVVMARHGHYLAIT